MLLAQAALRSQVRMNPISSVRSESGSPTADFSACLDRLGNVHPFFIVIAMNTSGVDI